MWWYCGEIGVRGWVDPRVIGRLKGLDKLKNSNDVIGNRTCDLPPYSIVPLLSYHINSLFFNTIKNVIVYASRYGKLNRDIRFIFIYLILEKEIPINLPGFESLTPVRNQQIKLTNHYGSMKYRMLLNLRFSQPCIMLSSTTCHITSCSQLKVKRSFGGACQLHIQGRKISQE
jgi:hypothetical protein